MGIHVAKGHFNDLTEVLEEIKQNRMWPTTYVSGAATAADIHWHSEEVHVYVMEGITDFLDGETGKRHDVMAGDKITVPARTLHAEGAVKEKVIYLIAIPEALPPDEFLKMRDPADLNRNG